MTLLLNPILEGLDAARRAAAGVAHPNDEVTMDDRGEFWVFAFVPSEDVLGGGIDVWVAKNNLQILKIIRGQ